MSKKSSAWITATVIGVVLILAVAWFGAASGQFAAAATSREQASQVEAQNRVLQQRVATLRDQYANLDQVRSEIDQLRVGIPTSSRTAELLRQVDEVARAHDVLLGGVSPGDVAVVAAGADAATTAQGPQDDASPAPASPSPEASATPSAEASAPAGAAAPAAPVAVDGAPTEAATGLVPEGFAAVPVTITAYGWARDAAAFVTGLQEDVTRLLLVNGVTMTTVTEEKAPSSGVPALQPGMVELTVQVQAYVLADRLSGGDVPSAPSGGPQLSPDLPAGKEPWTMPPANRTTEGLTW